MNESIIQLDERRGCTSASNAQADALCPGRHLAQKGIPDKPTEDSAFGNQVHDALLVADGKLLNAEQSDIYEACRELETKLVQQCFGEDKPKEFREERYWVKVNNQFEHSGKPDVVYRFGPHALILDYKTLGGDVAESPKNLQLRDLAVLVRGHFMVEAVAVAIVQPLATMTPELCVYDMAQLDQAAKEMFERIVASNNPNSPRNPGEVQCKFCKAKTRCKEYQKWAGSTVPAMASITDVPVESWTPEQRAIFCERKLIAQKWLDDCEARMKELLEKDPEAIPGWHLKEGAKVETITDPQAVFGRAEQLGANLAQFMACIDVGKGKLKDVIKTCTGKKGKALDAEMLKLLEGLTVTRQNRPSLKKKD